jgi:hypothetical protein
MALTGQHIFGLSVWGFIIDPAFGWLLRKLKFAWSITSREEHNKHMKTKGSGKISDQRRQSK